MFEQEFETGEVDHAEEVFDVVLIAIDEAAEPVQPGKQPFHLPAFLVSAQRSSILGLAPSPTVGCDQLNVVLGLELLVEPVRIVGFVPDEPRREFPEEAASKDFFEELALVGRSTLDTDGERKTVSSGDSEDFSPLASPRGPHGKAPFFALANVASTNASSRFSLPAACRCPASRRKASSNLPLRTHCWK